MKLGAYTACLHDRPLPPWYGTDWADCNCNPLNPLPGVGPKHADDLRRSIELARLLGVKNIVTMSGTLSELREEPTGPLHNHCLPVRRWTARRIGLHADLTT